ncbi:DUF5908 family protein [Flavobacterium aquicola]|uniref:Uncharacterized protein n=1 Tax=Flavobacterium aquicola TaxID=1682742 RepID=A0A3E0EP28_9FLAO|nr:DUF5908 family protein [Flavobacterium aquicola]REG99109.1 hypothetical protein C8P67_105279 [Flavobacterium aquicola]
MPIEIKELHIKINVNENSNPGAEPASSSSAAEKDIVAECVEQVMKIIERKKER